jgi:hypothetical protein
VPDAIQAAIWISFPGNKPASIEPLQALDQTMQTGLQQGMRIAQGIYQQKFQDRLTQDLDNLLVVSVLPD